VEGIDNVGLMVPADSQTFCHFSLLFRPSVGVSGPSLRFLRILLPIARRFRRLKSWMPFNNTHGQ
jgi:hypothetical protein